MMRKQSYPFAASAEGLFTQMLLLQRKGLDFDMRREYVFHPTRKWRFDLALTGRFVKIGVEYQGGLYIGRTGGHQTPKGMRKDWEKFNEAQILGWKVLLFGPDETRTGDAMNVVERAVKLGEYEDPS